VVRGVLSRADLVSPLAASEGEGAVIAEFIGARLGLEKTKSQSQESQEQHRSGIRPPSSTPTEQPELRPGTTADMPFWYSCSVEFTQPATERVVSKVPVFHGWRNPPRRPPPFQPLTVWSELAPRLRRVLSDYREGRAIDVDRTVNRIGRGYTLDRFPRERRRRWGNGIRLRNNPIRLRSHR
jgi:hypothetical protein